MNIFSFFKQFEQEEDAIQYLEKVRWNGKARCLYCQSDRVYAHQEKQQRSRWQCYKCCRSFSVTVGTIFHHSHILLNKWFLLMALMLNAKKGISSCQAARDLGMRQMTAWSMMHRICKAMATDRA